MSFYFGSLLWDLVALVSTVAAVTYAYFLWSYQYWKRRNIPYLEPTVPWGNFESAFRRTMSPGENITKLYQQAKAKGWKYFGIYLFAEPNLIITDLDMAKQVMTKDFNNFVDRGIYTNEKDDPLSAHLFAIGGTKWKNLRAKLSPTFTSGKMKSMFSTLTDCGLALEKYLEHHIDNQEGADIKDILGKFSTDIIGSCAFGLECNSFKDPNAPFRWYGKKLFQRSKMDVAKVLFASSFPNVARACGVVLFPKDVTGFMRKAVEDTITYRQKNNVSRNDFLQLIIDIMNNESAKTDGYKGDGKTLTMDEAAAQSFVFFVAGFETSSTTMTFALYEMARHQDIQDRVRKEIKSVLAKHDGQMTYDAVREMKYLKQVIDETLRMYSPVPFVTRVSAENYQLPGSDLVIEKGVKVMIPIRGIHYDEDNYENPKVFDPERFTEENKVGRHPYAHIPFGEGPRICIGERFGIMQTQVGLSSILRHFRVTLNKKTPEPLKLSTVDFIPTTEGGIWLNLERL